MKSTRKPAKAAASAAKRSKVFSDEELAALKETKAERRRGAKADGEGAVLAKIAEMKGLDRELAEKLHAIVKAAGPDLSPKTWYGMPAYAKDDKIVCFFTSAAKFKSRYATFGFNEAAHLDDGNMWPTSFALTKFGEAEEKKITALIKKAVG